MLFRNILVTLLLSVDTLSYNLKVTTNIKKHSSSVLHGRKIGKISDEEWEGFKIAIEENKDAFKAAFSSKKNEWKALKQAGVLDQITESNADEEMIEQLDRLSEDYRKGNKIKPTLIVSNDIDDDIEEEEYDEKDIDNSNMEEDDAVEDMLDTIFENESSSSNNNNDDNSHGSTESILKLKFQQLLSNSNTTAANMYSFINLVKDKQIYDLEFYQLILQSFHKLKSDSLTFSAFKLVWKLVEDGFFSQQPTKEFFIQYVIDCYINHLLVAGEKIQILLIDSNIADKKEFFYGELCASIIQSGTTLKNQLPITTTSTTAGNNEDKKSGGNSRLGLKSRLKTSSSKSTHTDNKIKSNSNSGSHSGGGGGDISRIKPMKSEELCTKLNVFFYNMKQYSIDEINTILRLLGKYRYIEDIFTLFHYLHQYRIRPTDTTYEFLASSLVVSVEEEASVTSMKDLPKPNMKLPEIVFAGRSNVGKSSLVNFLVNRKALASTSATPGHTRRFHFFNINQDRSELPSFRLVDVPGLGYAEAEDNIQDSWKSLLERYISVREPLQAVFHLIDSRHKVTPTDSQLMEIMRRAAVERMTLNRPPIKYIIALTKTDKAKSHEIKATKLAVTNELLKLIQTIPTTTTTTTTTTTSDNDKGSDSEESNVDEKENDNDNTIDSNNDNNNTTDNIIAGNSQLILDQLLLNQEVTILETSSTQRKGREYLWEIILKIIDK